ncbi:MAG: hypothetical protein IKV77_04525 [Alistipes sp.]|nr:hypothetical protein [Alistipes sp.]
MKTLNKVKCVCAMFFVACLTGCAARRIVEAPIAHRSDSTAIHVRYSLEYRPILVELHIPDIRETRSVRDTTSTLENDYAESTATVSGGVLTHSLNTKPHTESVEVNVPHERTDSVIYIYQDVVKIKEVEKPLSWWQNTQIIVGRVMIIALIILFLWRLLKCRISILK